MSRARRQAYFRASSSPSPSSSSPGGRRTWRGLKGLLFMTGVTSTFHPSSKWCKDCLVCDIYVAQPGPGCVRAVRTVLTSSCVFIKFFRLEKIN